MQSQTYNQAILMNACTKKPCDIYGDSILRKGMHFKDLGLTKYQSYYPNSKLLVELSK